MPDNPLPAHGVCKWCSQEFTLDTDEDLQHSDFDSVFITCDHCGHGAEYSTKREIVYDEPRDGN